MVQNGNILGKSVAGRIWWPICGSRLGDWSNWVITQNTSAITDNHPANYPPTLTHKHTHTHTPNASTAQVILGQNQIRLILINIIKHPHGEGLVGGKQLIHVLMSQLKLLQKPVLDAQLPVFIFTPDRMAIQSPTPNPIRPHEFFVNNFLLQNFLHLIFVTQCFVRYLMLLNLLFVLKNPS